MSNVKLGDLAIVTGGATTKGLSGRIVRVIRVSVQGEILQTTDGTNFQVDNKSLTWICAHVGDAPLPLIFGGYAWERNIADSILRPVSGLPDTSDVDEQLKEPA